MTDRLERTRQLYDEIARQDSCVGSLQEENQRDKERLASFGREVIALRAENEKLRKEAELQRRCREVDLQHLVELTNRVKELAKETQ